MHLTFDKHSAANAMAHYFHFKSVLQHNSHHQIGSPPRFRHTLAHKRRQAAPLVALRLALCDGRPQMLGTA
jgi:hypothetical protein